MPRKSLLIATFVTLAAISHEANAWWFAFIPGSAIKALGDAVTGSKGDICVKEGTQAGDTITSEGTGNTAKVLSVSGTSSICQNPALPIRAELDFTYNFSSKAGIDLPDIYEAKPLKDVQRFNGSLLVARAKEESNKGILISAIVRKPNLDLIGFANNMAVAQANKLKDAATGNPEQLTINGLKAARFTVSGDPPGVFSSKTTYCITILEGTNEYLVVNAYTYADKYDAQKHEMQQIAYGIKGLGWQSSN